VYKFQKTKFVNYFLIIVLVAISGFPLLDAYADNLLLILFIISIWIFIKRKIKFDVQFFYFIGIFIVLTLFQLTYFAIFPVITVLGLFLKIVTAYIVVKVTGKYFVNTFISLMVFFALISFIFFIPAFISSAVADLIINNAFFSAPEGFDHGSYLIYHLNIWDDAGYIRNCGPFWEPGTFGGYLFVAFLFSFLRTKNIKEKNNIILLLGTLSTFSTTSFIVILLFILSYFYIYRKTSQFVLILLVIIPVAFILFFKLPFFNDKISAQLEYGQTNRSYSIHRTRMTSAIADIIDFTDHPIMGRGKYEETRFDNNLKAMNRNNGTTDFLVIYGIIGFFVYFYFYYNSFYNFSLYNKKKTSFSVFAVIIILVLGFSESYFSLTAFWAFCFVGTNYKIYPFSKMDNLLSGENNSTFSP
jgi:hypothetical protein